MKLIKHPLRVRDIPAPIQTVLRDLAGQDGCDGDPYDQMMEAADYIDFLEKRVEEMSKHCGLLWAHQRREVSTPSEERDPDRHTGSHDHE